MEHITFVGALIYGALWLGPYIILLIKEGRK